MDKLNADGDALISGNDDDNGIDDSASEEDTNSIGEESNSSEHKNESEEGSSSVDEEESINEDDSSQDAEDLLGKFMDYALGYSTMNLTVERLQEWELRLPIQMIREKVLECNVLHKYLASFKWCQSEGGKRDDDHPPAIIELEVVQYLLELAPDAVNKADDSDRYYHCSGHPRGNGAHPLHLACFNADCPESIIKLLLDKNPMIAKVEWKTDGYSYGVPLCCYLERACKHAEWGRWETDPFGGEDYWDVDTPAFPSAELDYDIVELLVQAYPEALTSYDERSEGNPLNILCKGYDASVKLAKLLFDKERECLEIAEERKYKSPIWSLLQNSLPDQFPDDVFMFLFNCNPSSLEVEAYNRVSRKGDWDFDKETTKIYRSETPLNVACTNPIMSAKTIRFIIDTHPDMVRTEYRDDGYLPIHTLCKNNKIEELSSIAILRLLVSAFPDSVKKKVAKSYNPMEELGYQLPWSSDEGKTSIRLAEESGMSFVFLKALLSERAKLSSIPDASVLQVALIYKCKLETIQKLVGEDRGLLLREDGEGNIALHTARVQKSSLVVMQYLVNGIKPLLSDGEQLSSMPGASILHIACVCKCPSQIIKDLVEEDYNLLQSVDEYGRNVVHFATMSGSINIVKFLVDQLSENLSSRDIIGRLPIHIAASSKSLDIVKYLVGKDQAAPYTNVLPLQSLATLKVPDKLSGALPLHWAATHGSFEVVEYLVGMNESALIVPDDNGELPLHKACRRGNSKVVEYLIAKSSTSVTTKNYSHQLPIHLLCDKNEEYKTLERVQSVEYTECIFKMLTAFPEVLCM